MGRFEDEQEDGITLVPADAKDFVSIFAGSALSSGTSTRPVHVHIAPGVYSVPGPVRLPSNIVIDGSGSSSTIIQRDTAQTNIASRGSNPSDFTDPVLDVSDQDNVQIRGIKVIHNGTRSTGTGAAAKTTVALNVTDATRLTLEDCVFDGGMGYGMWGSGLDAQSNKVITDPLNWIKAIDCDFISDSIYGCSIVQRVFFATGCRFIVDTTGVAQLDPTDNVSPVAYRNWEYTMAIHRGCVYIVHVANGFVNNSGLREIIAAVTSIDTITTAELHLVGCQLAVRVSGDLTGTAGPLHLTCCAVGGDTNSLQAEGCEFTYETPGGGLTDADSVSALFMYTSSGGAVQESYLHGCNLWDKGGTGGATRKDIVYDVGTLISSGSPDFLQLYGCRVRGIGQFGSGGSTAKASVMGIQADTISFQGASAQFAAAATASVTLPIAYEASGTNYKVFCESDSNETIWVTAKTNSGFQLNSSNAASTAIIHYLVRR